MRDVDGRQDTEATPACKETACWCESLLYFKKKNPEKASEFIKAILTDGDGDFTIIVNERDDKLSIQHDRGNYADVGMVEHYTVCFLEYNAELAAREGNPAYYICGSQYYPTERVDQAIKCFLTRLDSYQPALEARTHDLKCHDGYTLEQIRVFNTKQLYFRNHYHYLDLLVPVVASTVFEENQFHVGFIAAHGDKARGYFDEWRAAGINDNRASLLYLFTYTHLMDRPKSESCQWVIDNYPLYRPMIEQIEQNIIKEQFS